MTGSFENPSRRTFMALAGTAAALASHSSAAEVTKTQVWVQLTTGGYPYAPTFQELFLDPMFLEMQIWPLDHPAGFNAMLPAAAGVAVPLTPGTGGRGATGGAATLREEPADYPWEPSGGRPHPGYDVLVLNDQLEWPDRDRETVQKAVAAGKGIILIHSALGDNQDWPWWYREVTGGLLVLNDGRDMKKSVVTGRTTLDLHPARKHIILRDVDRFRLVNEEGYRGLWQSPEITPLLETTSTGSDKVLAWIGPHKSARVVCIAPGSASDTHRNPSYRRLVRNSILWAAGRI